MCQNHLCYIPNTVLLHMETHTRDKYQTSKIVLHSDSKRGMMGVGWRYCHRLSFISIKIFYHKFQLLIGYLLI